MTTHINRINLINIIKGESSKSQMYTNRTIPIIWCSKQIQLDNILPRDTHLGSGIKNYK